MGQTQYDLGATALTSSFRDVMRFRSVDDDADETADTAPVLKLHLALGGGKESVVSASFDVVAGLEVSASLADQNGARRDRLTVADLGAETLGVGVATVAA
jgi:hypothetical protein